MRHGPADQTIACSQEPAMVAKCCPAVRLGRAWLSDSAGPRGHGQSRGTQGAQWRGSEKRAREAEPTPAAQGLSDRRSNCVFGLAIRQFLEKGA